MYPGIEPDRCIIRTSDLTPGATVVLCSRPDHDGRPCRTVGIGLYDDHARKDDRMPDDAAPGARTAPAVLSTLQEHGPLDMEALCAYAGATARSVELALDLLQRDGRVEQLPDGTYGVRD